MSPTPKNPKRPKRSYNPTKPQRALDKLVSAWCYLNWCHKHEVSDSDAMEILSIIRWELMDKHPEINHVAAFNRSDKWRKQRAKYGRI